MTAARDPSDPSPGQEAGSGRKLGPLLYLRGLREDRLSLVALAGVEDDAETPKLHNEAGEVEPHTLMQRDGLRILQYAFDLPARSDAWYELDGARYEVDAALDGDLRVAFVSCNGEEDEEEIANQDERNALWMRLSRQHREAPFQLLLQGGDQIYADGLAEAHPRVSTWRDDEHGRKAEKETSEGIEEVHETLRSAFLRHYMDALNQPDISWLMARVPSLAMWDDHDICDGWGSLPAAKLDSPVGRCLFETAREFFLLFQFGCAPEQELPDFCLDREGGSLSWHIALPGLHLLAPDLRSERRPKRVMAENGWRHFQRALKSIEDGRVLLISTVPALGPRLSWLEAAMKLTHKMEKYEDDLRDQWQSRSHRKEWRRFLEALAAVHRNPRTPITVLSGEIHLATRGSFDVPPAPLHQLVASGIAHPAPPLTYARTLGALAKLGETPVPGHPIRLHPLPGKVPVYTAQRNYLILERHGETWRTWWELDEGATPTLEL